MLVIRHTHIISTQGHMHKSTHTHTSKQDMYAYKCERAHVHTHTHTHHSYVHVHTYDPYEYDEYNGCERECLCGLVRPGHCVEKAPHHKEGNREEAAGEDDVPDPVMAAKLLEHVHRDKA